MPRLLPRSILNRLRLAFLLMLLAGIFQGISGLMATTGLSEVATQAAAQRLPASVALQSMVSATANFRIMQFQYTLAADGERSAMDPPMAALLATVTKDLADLQSADIGKDMVAALDRFS